MNTREQRSACDEDSEWHILNRVGSPGPLACFNIIPIHMAFPCRHLPVILALLAELKKSLFPPWTDSRHLVLIPTMMTASKGIVQALDIGMIPPVFNPAV